jgi:hypothetical protein
LFLHLLWCGWVLLGWTVTRCRRLLRTLHIASLIYAILIELLPSTPCPLTVVETWLEARAGIESARGPFLVRVLDAIVYPDLPEWLVVDLRGACLRGDAMRLSAALSSSECQRSMVMANQEMDRVSQSDRIPGKAWTQST